MIEQCPFCELDMAGNHRAGCPNQILATYPSVVLGEKDRQIEGLREELRQIRMEIEKVKYNTRRTGSRWDK